MSLNQKDYKCRVNENTVNSSEKYINQQFYKQCSPCILLVGTTQSLHLIKLWPQLNNHLFHTLIRNGLEIKV